MKPTSGQGIGRLARVASEGTEAQIASQIDDLRGLLSEGFSVGELVPSRTRPVDVERIGTIR